ncbi:MAG: hypothetical protein WC306_03085 [Candidatus Paceibacterota bacterium]|jgi:hypothetical protein
MKVFARKVYQRITNLSLAFVLVISSISAAVPLFLAQNTNAVADAEYSDISLLGWNADRKYPTGGYSVESFAGRQSIGLGIDNTQAALDSFYRYEGIKTTISQKDSIRADLYIDSDWFSKEMSAGLWVVGRDINNNISAYPIVSFTKNSTVTGWRIWNSADPGGWVNSDAAYTIDAWNTIELTLNKTDNTKVDVYINGVYAGQSTGDPTEYLNEIILNNYNYGTYPYSVHWSNIQTGNYKPAAPTNLKLFKNGVAEISSGSTVNYTDVILKWDTVLNAERYQIREIDPNGSSQEDRYTGWYTHDLDDASRHGHFGTIQGLWMYQVRVKDNTTKLWSDWTDPVNLVYDNTKPNIVLNGPVASVFNNSTSLVLDASDNIALKKIDANIYKVGINGVFRPVSAPEGSAITGQASYSHIISLAGLLDGDYFIKFNAHDKAGNYSSTTTFNFAIDNTAPNIPTKGQPNGTYKNTASGWNYSWSNESASGAVRYEYQASNSSVIDSNGALSNVVWNSEANGSTSQKAALAAGPNIPSEGTSDGVWYWQVRSVDAIGNTSSWSAVWNVIVDTQAPSTPEIVKPTDEQYFKAQPILNKWNASSDINGIAKYQVAYRYDDLHTFSGSDCLGELIDGLAISGCRDVLAGTSRQHIPGTGEQGGVTIWVRAIDNAGNISTWSNPVHYYYDTTAPDINLVSPMNNSVVQGISVTQSWSTTATDIDHFVYESWHDVTMTNPRWRGNFTSTSKTATGIADATYWWRVKAVDKAGNESNWSELWKVTVDNIAPYVEITNPTGTLFNTSVEVRGTVTDANPHHYWLRIKKNGLIIFSKTINEPGSFTDSVLYTLTQDGDYEVTLAARDATGGEDNTGNRSQDKTVMLTIDKTEPIPTLTVPSSVGNNATASIAATTGSGAVSYKLFIDGDLKDSGPIPFSSYAWDTTGLASGSYIVRLETTDLAGNTGYDEAAIVVDNDGPSAAITTSGTQNTASPIIGGTVGVDTVGLEVYVDDVLQTSGLNYTAGDNAWSFTRTFASGTYVIKVIAYDSFGNTSVRTASLAVSIPAPGAVNNPETPAVDESQPQSVITTPVPGEILGEQDDQSDVKDDGDIVATNGAKDIKGAAANDENGTFAPLGLAWYWWLVIIVGIASIARLIVANRHRREDKEDDN